MELIVFHVFICHHEYVEARSEFILFLRSISAISGYRGV